MLSIGLVGVNQEQYYTTLSREDYYTEGGEPPGVWFGQGAKHFGLNDSTEVDKETVSELVVHEKSCPRFAPLITVRLGFVE